MWRLLPVAALVLLTLVFVASLPGCPTDGVGSGHSHTSRAAGAALLAHPSPGPKTAAAVSHGHESHQCPPALSLAVRPPSLARDVAFIALAALFALAVALIVAPGPRRLAGHIPRRSSIGGRELLTQIAVLRV